MRFDGGVDSRSPESKSYRYLGLSVNLGWQDVKDTYRRSTLGPLWITVGLAVQVSSIGLVFGLLFGAGLETYIPFLTVSLILWNYLVQSLNDSSSAFLTSERILKQMYVPKYLPVLRVLFKNVIVFGHNLLLVVVVLLFFQVRIKPEIMAFIPGFVILFLNLGWMTTIISIVSARFRDFSPIIASLLTVAFYVTPIIWMPETIPSPYRELILNYNPFFHLMELVRAPLLGYLPGPTSWLVSFGLLAVGIFLARWLAKRKAWKIVYWL